MPRENSAEKKAARTIKAALGISYTAALTEAGWDRALDVEPEGTNRR